MTTDTRPHSPIATFFNWAFSLIAVAAILVFLFIMWPVVVARFTGQLEAPALAPATAVVRPPVVRQPIEDTRREPAAIPGIAQNEATATAQYNAAVQEAQHGAIVLPENDSAPVLRIQEQSDRQPAGDNVPVAEPIEAGTAPVVNIQETHACKHGQVWTEFGCKNPEGKGSKATP
jgi:hypothetical protein